MKKIDFKSELKVLKENQFYRFSDLFFKTGIRWKSDRDVILEKDEYKHTILRKYLEQKNSCQDFITLKKITREYSQAHNPKLPVSSELVIHLRCGDIFDDTTPDFKRVSSQNTLIDNMLNRDRNHIFNNEINKVSIVTALHFGANELNKKYFYSDKIYNENIIFLKGFENKINDLGYELNLVSNNDFDLDFCYMVNSKHFVKSISRNSNIVKRCSDKKSKIYSCRNLFTVE
jgi:hypothetical protein